MYLRLATAPIVSKYDDSIILLNEYIHTEISVVLIPINVAIDRKTIGLQFVLAITMPSEVWSL